MGPTGGVGAHRVGGGVPPEHGVGMSGGRGRKCPSPSPTIFVLYFVRSFFYWHTHLSILSPGQGG